MCRWTRYVFQGLECLTGYTILLLSFLKETFLTFPHKTWRTVKKSDPSPPPLAGWPFFNARVTLIARPTFLHLNTSARPAWVTLVLPPQSRGENHSMRECCCHLLLGGNNFFLILGTRYYLSLGGGGDKRGDHLIFGRTKGGMAEKLWKDSEGEPLKFARKMKTCGEGGGGGDATII